MKLFDIKIHLITIKYDV